MLTPDLVLASHDRVLRLRALAAAERLSPRAGRRRRQNRRRTALAATTARPQLTSAR